MQLVEISEKEFKKVADKSPLISFHQTFEWANLKKENGWTPYYLALKDKKKECMYKFSSLLQML